MCGIHDSTGTPNELHHGPIFRPRLPVRSRRAFLGQFGRGTLAMAVFTPVVVAACGGGNDNDAGSGNGTATTADDTATTADNTATTADNTATTADNTATTADNTATAEAEASVPSSVGAGSADELQWARANLGFVSAYVLTRGNSAAIVDTGTAGSAEAIGQTLQSVGLTFDDVDHLILTHKHGDHIGSMAEVAARAASAAVYAGEADLGGIDAAVLGDDGIVGLVGGEDVFGLEVLATPGHTAGHISVIDHTTGLLVAGDAIFTEDGGVIEGPEGFFEDVPRSRRTIKDLAALSFNTLLVGHGDPIDGGADTAVAALAASLP